MPTTSMHPEQGQSPIRISTHVLDTARGVPAAGITITLSAVVDALEGMDGSIEKIGQGVTNDDGRVPNLVPEELRATLGPGQYQVTFALKPYFDATKVDSYFFPKATIDFLVTPNNPHYHVPLLLSPFGFSTYRGS